jgi:CopG family nickel-responsive transcriptional regulator
MSDLVRFGVAMDRALLEQFDRRISQKGYENRSEALRDLVRADLTRAAWEGGSAVAGTLTLVYASKQAAEVTRLVVDASRLAGGPSPIKSATRVALDGDRTLEVLVLEGPSARLTDFAGRVGGARGVLSSELAIACALGPRTPRGEPGTEPGDETT